MTAIAGYFPHLPPTPAPIGGPIPDRRIHIRYPARHAGQEPRRDRIRRAMPVDARRDEERGRSAP